MTPATLTPPETVANPDRFSVALRNVSKVRPRVPVDTWTDVDAAAWWYRDYQPGSNTALPASMILAIVARLFVTQYRDFTPVRKLWEKLRDMGHWVLQGQRPQSGELTMNLSHFCGVVHTAYHPTHTDGTSDAHTGWDALTYNAVGYCGRKTCTHKYSWYRGCMSESSFDKLNAVNLLRPWSMVEWGGLGMLFPPLRHSLHSPYVTVRKERSHTTKAYVPYYVANKVDFLHRFAPSAMSTVSFLNYARPNLRNYIANCESQRMRFQAIVALSGDSALMMRNWDEAMTYKAWDFSRTDEDMVYDDDNDWGLEYEQLRQLQQNPPVGMFPLIS